MRARLIKEIDPQRDSLRFYGLGTQWRGRVEHVGTKPARDPTAPLLF